MSAKSRGTGALKPSGVDGTPDTSLRGALRSGQRRAIPNLPGCPHHLGGCRGTWRKTSSGSKVLDFLGVLADYSPGARKTRCRLKPPESLANLSDKY
jgi:hypothetical protein